MLWVKARPQLGKPPPLIVWSESSKTKKDLCKYNTSHRSRFNTWYIFNLLIVDSWGLDDVRTGQAGGEAIYRQNWGVIWGRVPVIWSATVILEWTMSLDSVLNLSVPTGALLLFVFHKVLWYRTEHEYFLQNKVHEHCENKSLQWSTLFFSCPGQLNKWHCRSVWAN